MDSPAPLYAIIPDDKSISLRDRAREQFLRAIKYNKPEVISSLAEEALQLYRPLYGIIPWTYDEQERDILIKKFLPADICNNSELRQGAMSLMAELYTKMIHWELTIKLLPTDEVPDGNYQLEKLLSTWKPIVPYQKISLSQWESLLVFWDTLLAETLSLRLYEPLLEGKSIQEEADNEVFFPARKFGQALCPFFAHYSKVVPAVRRWSTRWNLTSAWCKSHALRTLYFWCESGFTEDWNKAFEPDLLFGETDTSFEFLYHYPQWDPNVDSWQSYKRNAMQRLINKAEEELNEYGKQMKESMPGKRLKARNKQKRSEEHFTWLIEYQINGLEIPQIVRRYFDRWIDLGHEKGLDYSTVWEAIHSLANLIELTLRPANRKRS
jgi:hypothetical protein